MHQNISFQDYLPAILQRGDLQAVYDNSFDYNCGTVVWCLNGNESIIRGVNIVPIGSDILDSTQCELGGIYTILRIK